MKKKFIRAARHYLKEIKQRRDWQKVVFTLACVVVFCTTYAMILPAITLEQNSCGLTEHTHTDACYMHQEILPEVTDLLICGQEEHTHTDQCLEPKSARETAAPDATESEADQPETTAPAGGLPQAYSAEPVSIEGTGLTWVIDTNESGGYVLRIDGEGSVPDYTSGSPAPWAEQAESLETAVHLEFGENVTAVGARAFQSVNIASIQWGGVEAVGASAFAKGTGPEIVEIPGTVKVIGEFAFAGRNVQGFVLCEGVETIGFNALGCNEGASAVLHIPASVIRIDRTPGNAFAAYTVAEDNSNYACADGVLFTGDMKTLMAYPAHRKTDVYQIPDGVETVLPHAFAGSAEIGNLVIPASVTALHHGDFSGVHILTYHAENARITAENSMNSSSAYDLIVGAGVNYLPADFSGLASAAGTVNFRGENTFTAESGAFAGTGEPLETLSGTFHADANGVLYRCLEDGTAAVVYASRDVSEELVIPAAVQTEDGTVYPVTAVGTNAFCSAEKLTGLTFEAPEQIRDLAPLAMANCPGLVRVNGLYTRYAVEEIFTNASLPADVFYNTGLENTDGFAYNTGAMDGTGLESLHVERQGATGMEITITDAGPTMEWEATGEGTGLYTMETGDRINYYVSVGSTTEEQHIYRIYIRTTGADAIPGLKPGGTMSFNNQYVTCYATDDPNVIYLEYVQTSGSAIQFSFSMVYPSPSSPGGGAEVWGAILTRQEAMAEGARTEVFPSQNGVIQARWITVPYDFTLTKTGESNGVNIVGNGSGGCKPGSNLVWTVKLSGHDGDTDTLGSDHLQTATFTDSITLPEGFTWNPKVTEALESGAVQFTVVNSTTYDFMANGLRAVRVSRTSSSAEIRNLEAYWDAENGKLAFRWELYNNTEIDMSTSTLTLTVYTDALWIDLNELAEGDIHTVTNDVTAQLHYHYSDPVTKEATGKDTINSSTAKLGLQKTSSGVTYMGEEFTYTIRLYNDGVIPYMGKTGETVKLQDFLDVNSFISPEQMEAMFDLYGTSMEIIIIQSLLAEWESVTGVDGTQSWRTVRNSNLGTTEHILHITLTEEGLYQVAVEGGSTYTADSAAAALQSAGYAVGYRSDYSVTWYLQRTDSETPFFLDVGEEQEFTVFATAKDTFGNISKDYQNEYPATSKVNLENIVRFYRNNTQLAYTSMSENVIRDAYIKKSVYRGEELIADPTAVSHDEVVTYHLDFHHYGTGKYQDLPVVDALLGSQHLLVPVELNPQLSGMGLAVREVGGANYYLLDQEGFHYDVTVGEYYLETSQGETERKPMIAASIEVKPMAGMNALQIKWYFPELPGEEYDLHIRYDVLINLKMMPGMYVIMNQVSINDRSNDSIFDQIMGQGQTLLHSKYIVTQMRDINVSETLETYTPVTEGERVIYKLTVTNPNQGAMRFSGRDIADILPSTYGLFEWDSSDVELIKIETDRDTTEYGNLDQWEVTDTYMGIPLGDGIQVIAWPDDAYVEFKEQGSIHMYIALTYPDNGEDALWDRYAEAAGGYTVHNSFALNMQTKDVDHHLQETGKVLLQKGVSGMYYYTGGGKYKPAGESRRYYNNQDRYNRAVVYYVTIYNGGNKRLYLNDVYDQLPEGFTFMQMIGSDPTGITAATNLNSVTTTGSTFVKYPIPGVSYRNAKVTPTLTENGVKFNIVGVRYDSETGKYFLNKGEAVTFAYACNTGTRPLEELENTVATNAVAMPYDDFLKSGANLISAADFPIYAADSNVFVDANDGSRLLKTGAEVERDYGIAASGVSQGMWLVSEVDVRQGEIIPGVTKFADSYKLPESANLYTYTHSAPYDATINWRVRLNNSGTRSLVNYTFTDTMPAPYVFEGNIIFTYYDMHHNNLATQTVATIPARNEDDRTLSVVTGSGQQVSLEMDGPAVSIGSGIYLSLAKDEKGDEVLTVVCEATNMAIPEGGYVDVSVSSRNPTMNHKSGFYTNYASIYPNEQSFTESDHGHVLEDENGMPVGVIANSSVNIIFGYATSSEKRITEDSRPSNTAVSIDPLDNSIMLESRDSSFTYQLTVGNSTEHNMTKLVIIDNLPQPGDHTPFDLEAYRDSAFTVHFADDLNFTVKVTAEDGTVNVLESDRYILEFSESTDFGGEQSGDWRGEDTGKWSAQRTAASRSFRLVILDDTGGLIPNGARVDVTFRAKVGADARPGACAWNNFGYHFGVQGTIDEMEAMPLSVGVSIPGVPALKKQLVDLTGEAPDVAEENMEFRFLVYEGTALSGTYTSAEALRSALNAAGRGNDGVQEFTVTVAAGQTESAEVMLTDVPWNWTQGSKYTVVEIDSIERYDFYRFNNYPETHYTFTYDVNSIQRITCKNRLEEWQIRLTKTDLEGNPLSGAVFALYSPDPKDQLTQQEADRWGAEMTVTASGRTWYLASVAVTGNDGKWNWTDLLERDYYLLEIQAPDGYILPESGQILYQSNCHDAVCAVQVKNEPGYELPETGGVGTTMFYIFGSVMMLAAFALLVTRKRMADTV